jgi:hypothetical protein
LQIILRESDMNRAIALALTAISLLVTNLSITAAAQSKPTLWPAEQETGAVHWPDSGAMYYAAMGKADEDPAAIIVRYQLIQATDVSGEPVPQLRKLFTDQATGKSINHIYIFETLADFNKYFGTSFSPINGEAAGITPLPGQIPGHSDPITGIFKKDSTGRQFDPLELGRTVNHELGHQVDRIYTNPLGYPPSQVDPYTEWLASDVQAFNKEKLPWTGLPTDCQARANNWQKLTCWTSATTQREFFAVEFTTLCSLGTNPPQPGAIIGNNFAKTRIYLEFLRTGKQPPQ